MQPSRDSEYGVYRGRLASERDIASTLEEIVVMIIVMVLAAAIRLWKLGAWSFWADEVFSVQVAQKFPNELTINPIMYMIVRAFTDTLGISEWSARLGPCIIGILSVPLLYWPAKRIFSAKVGMIACVFLVIHPWHIFWSQNARANSLAFLFASSSAFLFYLALERDSVGLIVSSLFLTLLSIFSYLQTAMLLPALVGYVMLLLFLPVDIPRGLNGRNLITFFGPFILALLLLLLPSVRSYLYSGWGVNEWGRSPWYILLALLYYLGIPVSVTAFVGGVHSLVYLNRGGLFLICYATVPFLLTLIISPFLNVAPYYLFFTMPAYLILAAFCASELTESALRGSKILSTAVILVVLVASLSQSYLYFAVENGGRPKWREAFQAVKHRIGLNDTMVVSMPRIAEYYLRESNGDRSPETRHAVPLQVMQLEDVIARSGTLENLWRWGKQDVWFILDQPCLEILDSDNRFREWLYANCRLVGEFPVYARVMDRTIKIWHFPL
jgi:mannosyltransferase